MNRIAIIIEIIKKLIKDNTFWKKKSEKEKYADEAQTHTVWASHM